MTKAEIQDIEREFPNDGLVGMIYHILTTPDDYDYRAHFMAPDTSLTCVVSLEDGSAALAMKGSAPIPERRQQFLDIYAGCKRIAAFLKNYAEREEKVTLTPPKNE